MGLQVHYGKGLYTDRTHSQKELRELPWAGDAARLFNTMLRSPLWPFVGHIRKVFGPPKSPGMQFEFAAGKREEFVRLVDPASRSSPKSPTSLSMRGGGRKSPLIPDDAGKSDPNWIARRQAAANGLGVSFRQEGLNSSLHVAYDSTECDVHVDRNGFVVERGGKVHWDLNGLLRHLTVDLIPDKVPHLAVGVEVRDRKKRPIVQATLAPWVAVDLPSETSRRTDVKIGIIFQGRFKGL